MRTTGRGLEWLFAAPWRLVALVAIVVALPILALGELSANDAHERTRAAELDALAIAARRAAASLDDRVQTIAGQVSAGSATPVSGRPTPLLLALERNDPTALDSFASYLQAVLGDQVERVVVLDRAGHIVAAAPAPPRPGADYAGRDLFTQVSAASPTFISGTYLTEAAAAGVLTGSADISVIGVSVLVRDLGGARAGVVVAEVGLPLLGTALTPLLGAADDVYLIDGDGRLVLRATHAFTPDAAFGRDLRGSAAAVAALGGASRLAADDPLGGGVRLVGIAPASTNGWRVLAVRSPAALEAELDGSLAEQRAIRLGLIALLLGGAVLLGRTGSRALRQRSALAATLEQQTAVAEVLSTTLASGGELRLVLDAVVQRATQLCGADVAYIYRVEGPEAYRMLAMHGAEPNTKELLPFFDTTERGATIGRALIDRATVHIPDIEKDAEYKEEFGTQRTQLAVPLMRGGVPIGVLGLWRYQARPFTADQIRLVETFADQAAIAIENVRLFNEIQDKSKALAAASRHKSEFLANMSHELRTPLNAIIGFSDVLEQRLFGELNERQADYTHDIASSGRHLLDLVNEILDLSKVEAGRMELEPSAFAPGETIRASLAFIRERAVVHRIELTSDVPADLAVVTADERKIRQVLLNLLSNAVKFTPDGGTIAVTAREADGELRIAVHDSGIGIAPEDQAKVFDEFQQVGKSSDRSREGTGLGLTLAKRFIELHGGRIWIESEVGKGTTFTFAIPVGRAAAAPA
jgi:signal transduction histidine kinase